VIGGHSVDDQEIKFGYAVTGVVHPEKVVKNSGAKAGDVLVLTKPIGTGVISTGIKFEKASHETAEAAMKIMTTSAAKASKVMCEQGANGCTDITGFGLLGHAYEMAKASKVSFELESSKIPLLPDVIELIKQKMLTRGDRNNRVYVGETVDFASTISTEMQSALFDPQTAGGLLISINEKGAQKIVSEIEGAKIVGQVINRAEVLIQVL
jgi:selenide,water dikinase